MNQIIPTEIIEAYDKEVGPAYLAALRDLTDAFGAYVTKWQNHAVRCMGEAKGQNHLYYQGRVSLTTDIQAELYELKLDIVKQLTKPE